MWDIVLRSKGNSIVNSKCIHKIKLVADGSVQKYKAIFVARGFYQVEGIHYEESMSQARKTHPIAAKHVLRYLRGTTSYGLRYTSSLDMRMHGYANADWAKSAVDQQSNYGCCFTLGSAMVSWCSRKQSFVALSTIEAEYISLCVEVHHGVSLFNILADLFGHEMDSTIIHCDNKSFVKLSKNLVFHDN